jgi:intracellular multiplication protein IcmK
VTHFYVHAIYENVHSAVLLVAGLALVIIAFPSPALAQQQNNNGNGQGIELPDLPGMNNNNDSKNQQGRKADNPGLNLPTGDRQSKAGRAAQQRLRREQSRKQMRDQAFSSAVRGLFPLKPQEIRRFLQIYDTQKRAAQTPIRNPRPQVQVQTVSLDPGQRPLTIKMAPGHVTTLSILDITGQPWPVKDMTWAGDFEIIEPGQDGHIIRITPMSKYASGNISMQLRGLNTPVTMTLRTRRDVVQYRLDIRVPRRGPNAEAPLIESGISSTAGNPTLSRILEGVPPGKAEQLTVQGTDGRTAAYKYQGMTYVRTPLTLLSPGWKESVRSADGMHVYALNNAPVLLLSDQGRMIRANIKDKDESAQ